MTTAEMIRKEGFDQGHEKGLEKGFDQGRQKGFDQGRQSMLLLLLADRFGPLPAAIEERVRNAAPEQLDVWSRAVLRASTLDEVFSA